MKNRIGYLTAAIAGLGALVATAAYAGNDLGLPPAVPEPAPTAAYAVGAIVVIGLIAFKAFTAKKSDKA